MAVVGGGGGVVGKPMTWGGTLGPLFRYLTEKATVGGLR